MYIVAFLYIYIYSVFMACRCLPGTLLEFHHPETAGFYLGDDHLVASWPL